MSTTTRIQLCVMMFLQYFIWGAWVVTLPTYLLTQGFSGSDVSFVYTTTAWAAIISPLFMGMVADRFFEAQRVLGALHLVGAAFMYWATFITSPVPFFFVLLTYMLCYMPTVALTNSISFSQMETPEKDFPPVRVYGTIGWIVAGWAIVAVGAAIYGETIEPTPIPLHIAALCSVIMGLYSFSLPKTPPRAAGQQITVQRLLGLDALSLMRDRAFAVFVGASLLICVSVPFYGNFTNPFLHDAGIRNPAGMMTLGQVSEAVVLFLMPYFFVRFNVKALMVVSMLFWVGRYALFSLGYEFNTPWMLYLGVLFHGVCFVLFITGQIYVDNKAPAHLRSSAQGLIAVVTYGVGRAIGLFVAGAVVDTHTVDGVFQWPAIWAVPTAVAFIVTVAFTVLFRENSTTAAVAAKDDEDSAPPP